MPTCIGSHTKAHLVDILHPLWHANVHVILHPLWHENVQIAHTAALVSSALSICPQNGLFKSEYNQMIFLPTDYLCEFHGDDDKEKKSL